MTENGQEALEQFKKDSFQLIIMDVQMPVMDGFSATAAIRKLESSSGKHIPIIGMTAFALTGDREKCLAAGMDDYLTKAPTVEFLPFRESWFSCIRRSIATPIL